MPIYCYKTEQGVTDEMVFPFGEAPETVEINGEIALRDWAAEHGCPRRAGGGWPFECLASGVRPEQAGELRELFRREGVPTEVSSDGNPIYTSPGHRRKALMVRGFCDRNSYC